EALRALSQERFDVGLVDLGLPDSQGLETFLAIQRQAPHTPIVVVSGREDEDLRLQAVQEGAQDFLAKSEMTEPLLRRALRYAIERQRTQESLRESEERFRLLVEHAYDGISLCERVEARTPDGTIHHKRRLVLCNERYVQMSGYTREQLLACDDLAALDVNQLPPEEEAANRQRRARGLPYRGVSSWKRPDGQENYSEWVAMPIRLRDKLYTLGIDRDITERRKMENALRQAHEELEERVALRTDELARANAVLRAEVAERERAEEALRHSEAQFHDFFNSSPDAIFVEDFDGNVLDANPAACRLHGLDRAALVGRNVLDLVPPANRAEVARDFKKLTNGQWDRCEGFSWTADGRAVPIELRTTCILYSGRPALLLHVRDITERRRAEEALRQAEEKYRGIFENAVVGLSQ
ncbi:MAG: PAS domain S-box protein, partial [Verrucomicrobia bacterium]|nr:PAS domain S-box protein [Verrucomicrobiota bacterium]